MIGSSSYTRTSTTQAEAAEDYNNRNSKSEEEDEEVELKEYRMSEVKHNNGASGKPIWDGGNIYDITEFIANHPGGSEKIILAAGGPLEPWWNVYRQHYATDLPMVLLQKYIIGKLSEEDQDQLEQEMEALLEKDPYALEPLQERSELLKVHSHEPMNAEVPHNQLTQSYLTPNNLFYIRHHHPVPLLSDVELHQWRLKVDLTALDPSLPIREFSYEELKQMPKSTVVATLQCSGNRRGGYNESKRTSGTSWYQGAISTAEWGGVRLRDVLLACGMKEEQAMKLNLEHVRFQSIDGLKASVDLEKAMSLRGDALLAYEMNGEPLPRDHGFPLRTIVPGYVGVRNVKWLDSIQLAPSEAEGAWQRGLNYKTLPPSVGLTEAKNVDLQKIPAMQQASLFSGITHANVVANDDSSSSSLVEVSGWAWAGGGRNVVRVDVSVDGGEHWTTAEITEGGNQKVHRAWAWVFWKATLPKPDNTAESMVEVCSKAVDCAYNVQPQKADWNVRGLGNNGWFRKKVDVDSSSSQQKQ
eukprot:CAMPEP_0116011782 /NCGR_PEP_ID=MMETSP0321-20121206/4759_1 /TAXON_ID=163516 /ORGANISM="Leptocylindrus danicus var. danicus, Strain B650" /LENGTH=526 /DNA_ID=CAMNT_0003481053 /DNA_START=150 /DNA_END=1733 /DNA_ORIENTATION=+